MTNTSSLSSLFATLAAFQTAAVATPAGCKSPTMKNAAKNKNAPIQRIISKSFEPRRRRLQGETVCTQTNFLGNVTTACEEASGIQSSCTVTPDGRCLYVALEFRRIEALMAFIFNRTNSPAESYEESFYDGIFVPLLFFLDSQVCQCADSTPDCSVLNLTGYSFNACAVDEPEYSNTCGHQQEQGRSFCCDINDAKGGMKCCRSETEETALEYECVAGSDTGKVVLSDSSCAAFHNGQSCSSCEYCIGKNAAVPIVAYDCTEFGGTKRTCPDLEKEEFAKSLLGDLLDGNMNATLDEDISISWLKVLVDPRTGGSDPYCCIC
eukprot:scaffold1133_cov84-Cylindrotheca_fusiformis.AAC.5